MKKIKAKKAKKAKAGPARAQAVVRKMKRGYALSQKKKRIPAEGGIAIPTQMPPVTIAAPYPMPYAPPAPAEGKEAPEAKAPAPEEGIKIEPRAAPIGAPLKFEEREPLHGINMYYPLIPRAPKKGEFVYAYTNIRWDPKSQSVVYRLVEPPITKGDKELIERVKRELEERLDIDITKLGEVRAKEILREEIIKILTDFGEVLDERRRRALVYYIERDTIGFDKIHALMLDPNVEDISCDGIGIGLYVYHRDPRFASIQTNVAFETEEELNTFVSKLAQKANKTISIAEPLMDASLPDGSRIQATLGTDIARKGSNFTIRKFTEKPLTPTHILRYKTLDATEMAYLWLAVENGQTVLISGGTATGKTALLNALSLFIRPERKVVSIEDTAELRLPLPHWIPHVARAPLSIKGKVGEVTLFDLLKSSLRQRPDYLVLGEVRGKEAFVLFQQVATGHPALATMHAATVPQLIDRLITPPISLPPGLLENIDIVVFLSLSRLKGVYVRRAENITEVTGLKGDRPLTNDVFKWQPSTDKFGIAGKSVVLKKIARKAGVSEETISAELFRRKRVLEWMLERGVFDYKDVGRIISMYYSNPERIMDLIASA